MLPPSTSGPVPFNVPALQEQALECQTTDLPGIVLRAAASQHRQGLRQCLPEAWQAKAEAM